MLYESLIVFAVAFFAGLAFYGATHGRLSGNTRLVPAVLVPGPGATS